MQALIKEMAIRLAHIHKQEIRRNGIKNGDKDIRDWSKMTDGEMEICIELLNKKAASVDVEVFDKLMNFKYYENDFVMMSLAIENLGVVLLRVIERMIVDEGGGEYANVMYTWMMKSSDSSKEDNDKAVNVKRLDYFGVSHLEGELRAKAESWKLKNEFAKDAMALSEKAMVAL